MKWFKRMIVKWVREDWENAGQDSRTEEDCYATPKMGRGNPISTISGRAHIDSEPTLQFKVYSAVGGKVVEFHRYDPKLIVMIARYTLLVKTKTLAKRLLKFQCWSHYDENTSASRRHYENKRLG